MCGFCIQQVTSTTSRSTVAMEMHVNMVCGCYGQN